MQMQLHSVCALSVYNVALLTIRNAAELAERFKTDGMLAYVDMIQKREKEIGCDVLTHQKWSGADYMDNLMKTVTGGVSSTAAMGKGVTESQFAAPPKAKL